MLRIHRPPSEASDSELRTKCASETDAQRSTDSDAKRSEEFTSLAKKAAKLTEELYRRETSCGKSHDVRKMTKLRAEIARIKNRLERLQGFFEN